MTHHQPCSVSIWIFTQERAPQPLSALEFEDSSTDNSLMHGIPYASRLTLQIWAIVNGPENKEKTAACQRLAELCRAICFILSLPHSMKSI